MKLHTLPIEIEKAFLAAMDNFSNYYWCTAWAGIGFKAQEKLFKNLEKCSKLVVGTHFYQTHPDFIKSFMHCPNIRFVSNTGGVFHPKLFLFFNSVNDWTLFVGSTNFTKNAFSINSEVVTQAFPEDIGSHKMLDQCLKFINGCWEIAIVYDEQLLRTYTKERNNKIYAQKILNNEKATEIDLTEFQLISWQEYITLLKQKQKRLINRLQVLEISNTIFKEQPNFGLLTLDQKLFLAGVSSSGNTENYRNWQDFGTASRVKNYTENLRLKNSVLVDAVNSIPLTGEVTLDHYNNFKKAFLRLYGNSSVTSATRLLALKRPDTFYCYTGDNETKFADKFKIARTTVKLTNYWDKVVTKIRECNWYNNLTLSDIETSKIAFGRAALLDVLFYEIKSKI